MRVCGPMYAYIHRRTCSNAVSAMVGVHVNTHTHTNRDLYCVTRRVNRLPARTRKNGSQPWLFVALRATGGFGRPLPTLGPKQKKRNGCMVFGMV